MGSDIEQEDDMQTYFGWNFPPASHPANTLIDMDALRARLERERWRDWITLGLPRAKGEAARYFAANPEARAYVTPVWLHDGSVRLMRIGRRGGHRVLWTFRRAD